MVQVPDKTTKSTLFVSEAIPNIAVQDSIHAGSCAQPARGILHRLGPARPGALTWKLTPFRQYPNPR
jgi:hypothetical protein